MDYTHTHPRSPFTAVPVEEKQERRPFNVSERRGFSMLSFKHNCWHNTQPVSAFHSATQEAATHTRADAHKCVTKPNAAPLTQSIVKSRPQ